MAKKESLIDCCIRILRNASASDESKDLAECVLRSELEKPTVIERSYPVYIDRYRHRPWYNDWQIYCQAQANMEARGAFATTLSTNAAQDQNIQALASCLKTQ